LDEEQITFDKAAEIAGRDTSTLRRAAQKGELKAIKFGNTWVTTESAVRAWLEIDELHKTGPKKKPSSS